MKFLIFTFFFIISHNNVFGSSTSIESFLNTRKNKLTKENRKDFTVITNLTRRLTDYYIIKENILDEETEKLPSYFYKNRIKLKINSENYFIHLLSEIDLYYLKLDYVSAIKTIHKIELNKNLYNNQRVYHEFIIKAAEFYSKIGRIDISNQYVQKIKSEEKKTKNPNLKIEINIGESINLAVTGKMNEAIKLCSSCSLIVEKNNLKDYRYLNTLGAFYIKNRDFEKAELCFNKTIKLSKIKPTISYANLIILYLNKGETNKVKINLDKIKDKIISDHRFKDPWISYPYYNLCFEYFKMVKSNDSALIYKYKSDSISSLFNNSQLTYQVDSLERIKSDNFLFQKTKENNAKIKKRNLIIKITSILLITFIVLTIIVFFRYRKIRAKNYDLVKELVSSLVDDDKSLKKPSIANDENKDIKTEIDTNLILKFEKVFIDKKMYQNTNVNLNNVSKKIGSNTTDVSNLINSYYKVNFRTLVNQLRINDAKIMLISNDYKNYSIEGIASIVGYNHQSTFNKNFKEITGVTPLFFKESSEKIKNEI